MSTKRENIVTDSDTKKSMDVDESQDSGCISGEIESTSIPETKSVKLEKSLNITDSHTKKSMDAEESQDFGFFSGEISGTIDSPSIPEKESVKREQSLNTTDSHTKKSMDVEESQDFGFVSGEIESTSIPEKEPSLNNFSCDNMRDSKSMRSDSGIPFLSGQLSELSLGSDGKKLNNLSGSTSVFSDKFTSSQKQDDSKPNNSTVPSHGISESPDSSWEYYFQQDEDGDTPLHLGIIHGFTEAVHSLIRLAPYPHLLDVRNDTCQSPLHLAVLTGQSFIVRLLTLAGAKQSVRDRYGETALHLACHKGDLLCVRALTAPIAANDVQQLCLKYTNISHEPINYEQWNYEGETCLHVAAMQGHRDILRHLVWLKADINAREGKSGYTPLHYAVARKDTEMLEFLLNDCKDLNLETQCYSRLTAYEITRDPDVRSMLVSKGAVATETDSEENSSSDDEDSDNDKEMLPTTHSTTHYTKSTGVPINASA